MRQYRLRPPLLNDSRSLRHSHYRLFPDTIAANRRLLRAMAEDESQELLIFEALDTVVEPGTSIEERQILAVLRVLRASEDGRYELHFYPDPSYLKDPRATVGFCRVFQEWLKKQETILQIGFLLPLDHGRLGAENALAQGLDTLGFIAESSPVESSDLLRLEWSSKGQVRSTGVMNYRRWFWDRGMHGPVKLGFVLYQTGIALIRTDMEAVRALSFLEYGEVPDEPWIMNEAWRAGLSDVKGRILSRSELDQREVSQEVLADHADPFTREAIQQVRDYFARKRMRFTLPFATDKGTAFQRQVWRVLETIPYGSTRTYEEIGLAVSEMTVPQGEAVPTADELNMKGRKLARAVGGACAANPIQLLIPCHRVIGKDGHILGYSGDPKHKSSLLWEEQVGYATQNH